jgi:hypothetical protein
MPRFKVTVEVPTYYDMIVHAPDKRALNQWLSGDNETGGGSADFIDDLNIMSVDNWDDVESMKVVEKRELKKGERVPGSKVRINKKGELL